MKVLFCMMLAVSLAPASNMFIKLSDDEAVKWFISILYDFMMLVVLALMLECLVLRRCKYSRPEKKS